MLISFGFKIFLTNIYTKTDLVIYYTIIDTLLIISRVFIGYKDALTTLFHKNENQINILRLFTVFLIYVVLIVSFLIIPVVTNYYLISKIDNFDLQWWYISIIFITMNMVAYLGYIFLVTKHYKLISVQDILKTVFFLLIFFSFYLFFEVKTNYKFLIYTAILSNLTLFIYLLYKKYQYLPQYKFTEMIGFKLPKSSNTIAFFKLTSLASSNYFIYGLLLYAPIVTMLNHSTTDELANFQVVARSIYFALISIFSWPLGRFMFPEFSSLIAKQDYKKLLAIRKKFINLLVIFGFVVIGGCWLLSEYVIRLIFPIEYLESYKMLNILIIALPFVMYTNFSESILKAESSYIINLIIRLSGLLCFAISFYIFEIMAVKFASIYSFLIGILTIYIASLYFEKKICNNWIIK
jgi:O-antigen/teichoic acid export membrane protein